MKRHNYCLGSINDPLQLSLLHFMVLKLCKSKEGKLLFAGNACTFDLDKYHELWLNEK